MYQNKQNKYGKYQCPCCGYYTFEEPIENHFDICDVCCWEDDGVQLHDPDFWGGANSVSLNEARENFKKFGASDERCIDSVRPPRFDEYE
ncbi:MAG: hypothetical protein KDC07_12060 [Chitinophagaceae bacterium]|nr:hypothetical protein [Chitinophagaceae bacterium]MCB9045775.1 hydrolase [Chitinophagales bacterium]